MNSPDANVTLIRLPKVKERVGLGTSQIYAMMSSGRFPRPVRLGVKAVAWNSREVDAFIADRLAERDAAIAS
jgi:prophage regulatory protein